MASPPFTVAERFNAGITSMMLAPDVEERKRQKQRKIDKLQAMHDASKRQTLAELPRADLPFPTSPPTALPDPTPTPVEATRPSAEPPVFDCLRCKHEIYPVTRCTCHTPKERCALWKHADDQWYKDDPTAWFDFNAPPPLLIPTPDQIWAKYDRALQRMGPELARKAERKVQKAERRKAAVEAARAPLKLVAAEAAAVAATRLASQSRRRGEIWLAPIDDGAAGSMMYMGDADTCVVPVGSG
ncbi:hypothetical protein B0H19DRAFT_1084102 [Mycena capillaripes]|nr:hypothetical protein B0H19DRAFT_1084102 [Mycena capillaripes]